MAASDHLGPQFENFRPESADWAGSPLHFSSVPQKGAVNPGGRIHRTTMNVMGLEHASQMEYGDQHPIRGELHGFKPNEMPRVN